ncbi:hypothetical protein M5D96_003580 [Drosophila gunungcola]|uniref:Uncharacterized protein n=1 Tax=Drosophila gunungcola TaxID=103775 RepID=A0A9P9YT48_9MUSC|nr:hypothetical protein M5D96_003580 [Drosophila gunungcola]
MSTGQQQQQHGSAMCSSSEKEALSHAACCTIAWQVRVHGEAEATHPEHAVFGEEAAPGGEQSGWSRALPGLPG